MNRESPHILVVGTGSGGGIGRFERLLMAALDDLGERGVVRIDSIWRRLHPSYLRDGARTGAADEGRSVSTRRPIFVGTIARAVVHYRPDLVLFTHINLARAAPVLQALGKRPYVIATYGIEVWSPLDWPRRRPLLGASGVLSISDYTAEQLERQQRVPRERVHVIPLALEPRWLESPADTSAPDEDSAVDTRGPIVLSVSRLESAARDKGIDQVIRALPSVQSAIPAVRYHVVGDGDDRGYLERLANESAVAGAVVFRGLLPHEELVEEYRQAMVFVLPSQTEGFGLVFLEAMAYSKPIIARRAAATPEVISDGQTGLLIDDEPSLASAITALLSDPDRARAMGRVGLERLREVYSFEAFTSRIENALLAGLVHPTTQKLVHAP